MKNRSVAIRDDEVIVKSTFYSTSIPLTNISSISTVVPGSPSDLVGMRVNGVGLPGFRSGWFDSKAGGRLFVDRVAGDYLSIFVNGKPRLALQFSDNQSAAQILSAAIPKEAK
ncbi:PH domain-containing protein [Variovorax sp. HW608]|nr:PH domain-containing protein [Variovorax sp. HW608]